MRLYRSISDLFSCLCVRDIYIYDISIVMISFLVDNIHKISEPANRSYFVTLYMLMLRLYKSISVLLSCLYVWYLYLWCIHIYDLFSCLYVWYIHIYDTFIFPICFLVYNIHKISKPVNRGRVRFGAAVSALDNSAPDISASGLFGAGTFFF